jgi:hypothetical protein
VCFCSWPTCKHGRCGYLKLTIKYQTGCNGRDREVTGSIPGQVTTWFRTGRVSCSLKPQIDFCGNWDNIPKMLLARLYTMEKFYTVKLTINYPYSKHKWPPEQGSCPFFLIKRTQIMRCQSRLEFGNVPSAALDNILWNKLQEFDSDP